MFYLFTAAFAVLCAVSLEGALTPLVVSFILAYLLFPLIRWLESHKIGRNTAAITVLSLVVSILLYLLLYGVPLLISQGQELAVRFPDLMAKTLVQIQALADKLGMALVIDKEKMIELIRASLSRVGLKQVLDVTQVISHAFSGVVHSILFVMNLFLFPIFFFFVINRFEDMTKEANTLIPVAYRQTVQRFSKKVNAVLSGYIRGQLMVALILAVMYSVGFTLVGVPFALFVGLATGLMSIIPYVGMVLGLLTSLALVLANFTGIGSVFALLAVFAVVQAIESFIITPKIVGDKVGIGTLETMLALIIGGNLFGFIGMLIAIPVAGIVRLFYSEIKPVCID